jgi:uncharacterized protein involved in type VI secretion and phage assembly
MNLERVVANLVEKVEQRFYGKYRGIVVDNRDPSKLGRLKLRVPSVLGKDMVTGWATPCAPYGGAANLGFLFIPEPETGVWTEFEEGDLEFPIWSGAFWSRPGSTSEVPRPNSGGNGSEQGAIQDPPTAKIIKTTSGHTMQFEDAKGAEMILIREGKKGHLVTMDLHGITITDANANTIQLTSDGIKMTDRAKNVVEMSSDGFTITAVGPFKIDASGQTVTVVGSTIDFQKG